MIEMTLSSRHRIRNSSPGGLRPSTLPLGHGGYPQYSFTRGWGRNIFCFLQTAETGNRTPNSGVKGSGANHYPRAPAKFVVTVQYPFQIFIKLWAGAGPQLNQNLTPSPTPLFAIIKIPTSIKYTHLGLFERRGLTC